MMEKNSPGSTPEDSGRKMREQPWMSSPVISAEDPAEEFEHKKRRRSPLYPAICLEEAIRRAQQLYAGAQRHPADLEATAELWGTKTTSSALPQFISALKQFGLVRDLGSGNERQVQLTDLALDILLHDPDSSERIIATKTAALTPKLHSELWQLYGGEPPASDSPIRSFLLRHKNFNPGAVNDFIRQFRDTIAFANLEKSDKIPGREGLGEGEGRGPTTPPFGYHLLGPGGGNPQAPAPPQRRLPLQAGMKEDTYTLERGQVVLQWPDSISPEEFEDLQTWLQLMIRKVKRSVLGGSDQAPQEEE